jgi:membrane protein YqaA with SNARE-associated domain
MTTSDSSGVADAPVSRGKQALKWIWRALLLAAVVASIVACNRYVMEHPELAGQLQAMGYPGLFLVAAISGFNVLVPLPVAGFTPALTSAGYDPWMVILVFSLGMSLGDFAGYLLGLWGRHASGVKVPAFVQTLQKWSEEKPAFFMLAIFLYASFVPMPNEVFVIPLAFARVAWHRLLIPIAFGHVVLNTMIHLGFDFLSH